MPNTAARKQLREERVAWLQSTKNKPCADCGGTFDPVCMDYHHIDPSTKYKPGGIMGLIKSGYGMDRIQGEIDQCVCLCANCHRLRHKDDPVEL